MTPELIEFVRTERPEVLPGTYLEYDDGTWLYVTTDNNNSLFSIITDDHAAALLVNWFIEQMGQTWLLDYLFICRTFLKGHCMKQEL